MPKDKKANHSDKREEEFASANDERRATGDDRDPKAPLPQGGKGTPSQAEGDRDAED
jgi:hypothetical protein